MILHYHNAMSKVKLIIIWLRMCVHITIVNLWLIYCVSELYEYFMYAMVYPCSCLLLSDESKHRHATFYSKLTVSYIKTTHRNYETEILLPYSEFKKLQSFHSADSFRPCIFWLHTRSSFTEYGQNVYRYDIFVHSGWVTWQVCNRVKMFNFLSESLIFPGLIQEICRIIIFQ
jgi:hypothetical protein